MFTQKVLTHADIPSFSSVMSEHTPTENGEPVIYITREQIADLLNLPVDDPEVVNAVISLDEDGDETDGTIIGVLEDKSASDPFNVIDELDDIDPMANPKLKRSRFVGAQFMVTLT